MKHRFMKWGILLLTVLCLMLAACGKNKALDPTDPSLEETVSQGQGQDREQETNRDESQPATQNTDPTEAETAARMPWEADGAKQPEDYTMEEYEGLTAQQRQAFREYLGASGYAAWLERSENETEEEVFKPWEVPGARQPKDYSWAEYQALTEAQKKAFMEALGPQGLEAWLKKVQNQDKKEENPWDAPGAKQPKDYTWAEYAALTSKQQTAFANHLGASGYQAWLRKVQGQKEETYPWEKAGAKQPVDYTWEEYEALSQKQQKAFRTHLGTAGFEAWLDKVLEKENPWEESGAKQPGDYNWEEYSALTDKQKKAFQEYLGAEGFLKWQEKVLLLGSYPWEEPDAKQPANYSWKEYTALTEEQRAAFQAHLGEDAMLSWLRKITDLPWEEPDAKQPEAYTLKEYETLKDPQKLAFRICLGAEKFEAWLTEAQKPKVEYPWEKPGAKQPADYNWEEFQALTIDQQIAFQNHLGEAGFEAWLEKVQTQTKQNPWEKPGAKQPADYTLEEFEALTADQQMAFQAYLGADGFETWLKKVQSETGKNPWELPGGKKPEDYTWEEFEMLTAAQQMAFQNYLGEAGFEAWLNKVQPQEQPAANPWEAPGAKQPGDYTWEEFEALTAAQQMAFQVYLGADGFEAWLNKVQSQEQPAMNPWEVPGAKQPQDYTWEEFEALTGAQQMAFQAYLGPEGFAAWLNRVQG